MKELTREQVEYAVGRLVRLVESRGIKQTQLEQSSGVNQSTISKILSGWQEPGADKYTPSEDVLTKLFAAIGLKLADILNESDHVADELIGYMATPLTGLSNSADKDLRRIVKMVRDLASHDEFSSPKFAIYWPGDHTHPKHHPDIPAGQVYITDRSRASTHDFIILFCGAASFGVGQENEIACQAGVPAIRLMPKTISRMMSGSFLMSTDILFEGSLENGVAFDAQQLRTALHEIRKSYFRHRALYRGMNGDAFGQRLRKLVDDRCGDYEQFAHDLGINLSYLHSLLEEPFAVSNPSARLLKRMAMRLGEGVGYLIGESEESDSIWIESNATWRAWIEHTPGIEAASALAIRDEWRHEYNMARREHLTATSHRESVKRMNETDWDKRYQLVRKKRGRPMRIQPGATCLRKTQSSLVAKFVERSGFAGASAEEAITRLVEGILRRTDRKRKSLASTLRERNVHRVELVRGLPCEGSLEPIGSEFKDGFIMRVKRGRADVRIRFTMAHELCHTFFYELVPEIKFVPHQTDNDEERLCNIGAAALLLPESVMRRRTKELSPSIEALEQMSAEYRVSTITVMLRLRALGLWNCELSLWHRMSDGRFTLDRLYGGRQVPYQWNDTSILERASNTNKSVWGNTFLFYEDRKGVRRYRPVCYEVHRTSDGVVALWGKGVAGSTQVRLPPLLDSAVRATRQRRGQKHQIN